MFSYGSFRLFVLKAGLGLFFVTCSVVFLIAFAQRGITVSDFKNIPLEHYYKNIFYYYLAVTTNLVLVFVGFAAYLIPIFLLANGAKLLLGIKTSLIFLKFILLLFTISTVNFSLSLSSLSGSGLLGEALVELVPNIASTYFLNKFILLFANFLLLVFSIILILISFDVKLKRLKIINYIVTMILKGFLYTFAFLKYLISYLVVKKKKISATRVIRKRGVFKKSEPTLKKKQ